jgi:glycosyltransferase involved in cell wall biosynthesis
MGAPLVSVVIPTTNRPHLVTRAIQSVLAQTITDLEVIVAVDGPNPETLTALAAIADPRVTVVQHQTKAGAGAARNLGAEHASGKWIAFLDDDDEWLPAKLERQLALAGDEEVLVSCRSRVDTPHASYVWPRSLYEGAQPIDEYLFDRKTLFRGATLLQTSSYLLPKSLFDRTRFGDSRQNEDTTLLLRVTKQEGARIVMAPETLVVLHAEEARESLGSSYDWREMLAWADQSRPLLTRRAYSGFCLIYLGSQAARHGHLSAFPLLLWRAFTRGSPTARQLAPYLAFWILPIGLRRRIRAILSAGRGLRPVSA